MQNVLTSLSHIKGGEIGTLELPSSDVLLYVAEQSATFGRKWGLWEMMVNVGLEHLP